MIGPEAEWEEIRECLHGLAEQFREAAGSEPSRCWFIAGMSTMSLTVLQASAELHGYEGIAQAIGELIESLRQIGEESMADARVTTSIDFRAWEGARRGCLLATADAIELLVPLEQAAGDASPASAGEPNVIPFPEG